MVSSSLRDVDVSQKHVERHVSASPFHDRVADAETFCNLREPETCFRMLLNACHIYSVLGTAVPQ